MTRAAQPIPDVGTGSNLESRFSLLVETTKPGITRLVTAVSVVAFLLAAASRPWSLSEFVLVLVGCVVGTALSASGANALNQWYEQDRDARMARTAGRPLPRGVLGDRDVVTTGIVCSAVGIGVLAVTGGWMPALVSAVTICSYLFLYTPLKPVTTTSTIVGAIPGALPTLIGWTAGAGTAASVWDAGGWSLFAILFVWQIPHFLALAWKYRDDYERGGYRVLPMDDPRGRRTAAAMAAWTACLLPVTVAPAVLIPDILGLLYLITSIVSGLGFAWFVSAVVLERTPASAMRVFFASIVHLPLLLVALVLDAAWHTWTT